MSHEATSAPIEAFQRWLESHDRSPHSIRAYLSDLRQFAGWFEEHTGEQFGPAAVTEYDVRGWRDALAAKDRPATVNRKLASLATFFRWTIESGQSNQDPSRFVNGVAQQPAAPKALPEQAVTRIMRKVHQSNNSRDIALLELLAATGLRVSEVAALTAGDITLGERSGWVLVRSGKGRRQRRVPINAKARRAIIKYLEERNPPERAASLFLTQRGLPMTTYAIWYTVKKYAAQAGVEGVTTHSWRHTVATRLVRDPAVDLVTAAAFLGHARLDTTARYSQPGEDDLAEAAERI